MANPTLNTQNSKLKTRQSLRLLFILLIYLGFAGLYSIVTPVGRGADEWAHYWYAQFIVQHQRLPLTVEERETAGYKSDWPPLYHVAAAAVTGWVDTAGPPDFKYRADSIRRQLAPAAGSDAILHTEDELFPWRQEVLVWHLGRFLSIAFSAGTLVITYFIAREVLRGGSPKRKLRTGAGEQGSLVRNSQLSALLATSILAFTPRFLFTGMLFNYDSLTLLLASLFLWLALRVAKGCCPRWGFWGLGTLAGLALITKYLTALLPLVIVAAAASRIAGSRVAGNKVAARSTQYAARFTLYVSRFTVHVLRSRSFWCSLGQAAIAYVSVTGWWFAYLIKNFNEIDAYGFVLGTLAPLIRGDASDRTVEQLFAWLSGGQSPPPAYINAQPYTAWEIITSFFSTLWANPISQPYPLNWFVAAMTLLAALAVIGLFFYLRFTAIVPKAPQRSWAGERSGICNLRTAVFANEPEKVRTPPCVLRPAGSFFFPFIIHNSSFIILLMLCLLPTPFMLIRLFGARDALEAVQGRHILFLAGPAVAVLMVLGLATVLSKLRFAPYVLRFTLFVLPALLLTGSISQLIFMTTVYPPPLPVLAALSQPVDLPPSAVTLPGGSVLRGFYLEPQSTSLRVSLFWQGGPDFAPEDYRLELALVNPQGQAVSGWLAYQTQARYPTRVWEPGDIVRDDGRLPLVTLPSGSYTVQARVVGQAGPVVNWQTLGEWRVTNDDRRTTNGQTYLWRDGQIVPYPPVFRERETAQFTVHKAQFITQNSKLTGPAGITYPPASAGPGWANFIIEPHWPAGLYRLGDGGPELQVAPTPRQFAAPPIPFPLEANFAGKIRLLGYDLPARRVDPGGGLPVTLFWQGQEWLGEDFVIFTRLLDNSQVAHGGYDRRAKENYSTLYWAPGEIITDGFAVPVDPAAPNGVYTLSVGWYRRAAGGAESLPLINPDTGEPMGLTAVTLGPIKVGGPPPGVTVPRAAPENVINAVLGDQIKLLGFDVSGSRFKVQSSGFNLEPGTLNLKLTFYWQAITQPAADYTVFVHVRDAFGQAVAQKDRPPVEGAYPTGLWDAGEIINDELEVTLGPLPPGRYQVVTGLYDAVTGGRLAVEGSVDEAILLQEFEVGP